jgi:hypothetical protein
MDQSPLNRLRQQNRADLAGLLEAINGASNALRRDECGDPVITGSRGAIRSCNGKFSVYVTCRSARHWHFVKKALSGFCAVTQDGDDDGIVQLKHVPTGDEVARLRDAIGLRQTRPNAADHLASFAFSAASEGDFSAVDLSKPAAGTPVAQEAAA